ncbi:putative inactive dehydrogenase EasA [Hypsizygus marmoreus]|uniref:Inactive dehydrogenase EasA n=1 Tax=Hypsizygus marmoreus TaxID=39966 RepID=A0A369J7T9_HYPMA|nr:putative inactive dehydrogenase EasA [Hypsizygus marmoreus]
MSSPPPTLFQPIDVGGFTLSHRVVFAPLTRFRATKSTHVPIVPLVKEYYSQRSRTPGTLLISEGTLIAAKAGGYANVPGIWSAEQISAWKQVTDAVHANGSHIFLQLWAVGRGADPLVLSSEDPSFDIVGPSAIPLSTQATPVPHELSITEIQEYINIFAQAAKNAVFEAGFDGVEVHGANGYLIDQFFQDVSNTRTDAYGGSTEKRSRFALEIIDAVAKVVGVERTGVRLSPWSKFQDMGMADPIPQFTYFVTQLRIQYPTLAYLHVVEPRISGSVDRVASAHESNDFIRAIWKPLPYITAGAYTRESALQTAEETGELVTFGRLYISNPDLPYRLKHDIPLTPYDRSTFYVPGERADANVGYIDYPFADVANVNPLHGEETQAHL